MYFRLNNLNAIEYGSFQKNKRIKTLCGWYDVRDHLDWFSDVPITSDNEIRICPECIKYGYHSPIHQIRGLTKCFLHPETDLVSVEKDAKTIPGIIDPMIDINFMIDNSSLMKAINKYTGSELMPVCIQVVDPQADGDIQALNESIEPILASICTPERNHTSDVQPWKVINRRSINTINKGIAEDMIKTYSMYASESSAKDIRSCILKPNPKKKYQLSGGEITPQEWCFMSVLYDVINEGFHGQEEWTKLANIIVNHKIDQLNKEDLHHAALIMASYSITNKYSIQPNFTMRLNKRGGAEEECPYRINVFGSLEKLRLSNYGGSVYNSYAEQYIFYPIIEDVYHIITESIYNSLGANESVSEVAGLPQYVLIFYRNKVEIHKCDDEGTSRYLI